MVTQPRKYLNNIRLRNHAYGTERRRNMSKIILEHGTPFPKPIEYSDIDQAMFDWLDEKIDLVYDGKRLPTYKLYSFQRLSEYAQTWKNLDENGNLVLNFKTITRENNPQKGEMNGNYFNIPGHKDFAMFYVPVMEDNGVEAYDKYTMKQPFQVNFTYTISIVSNKMEILNEMNEKMHYEFNAINTYISPNGHPMSMILNDVSDDSEYAIDDWRYYSCSYKIVVRGYIIRKEDYKVERIPSRLNFLLDDSDSAGKVRRKGKNRRDDERVVFDNLGASKEEKTIYRDENCEVVVKPIDAVRHSNVSIEELAEVCHEEKDRYFNKRMRVILDFGDCDKEITFEIDKDMNLETIETDNVYDFVFMVNCEVMDFMTDVNLKKGDKITVKISKDDEFKPSLMTLIGYDPNSVVDRLFTPESQLDEVSDEEEIIVVNDEEDD